MYKIPENSKSTAEKCSETDFLGTSFDEGLGTSFWVIGADVPQISDLLGTSGGGSPKIASLRY